MRARMSIVVMGLLFSSLAAHAQEEKDAILALSNQIEERGQFLQHVADQYGLGEAHALIENQMKTLVSFHEQRMHSFVEYLTPAQIEEFLAIIEQSPLAQLESVSQILNLRSMSSKEKILKIVLDIPIRSYEFNFEKMKHLAEKIGYEKVFRDMADLIRSRGLLDVLVWMGNLTWGLPNSVMGFIVVISLATVKTSLACFDRNSSFPWIAVSENGKQIYVNVSNISAGLSNLTGRYWLRFSAGKISLGIWEIDLESNSWSYASFHEGGHAIQSALLGPFYLPFVFGSYAIEGYGSSTAESWATGLGRY